MLEINSKHLLRKKNQSEEMKDEEKVAFVTNRYSGRYKQNYENSNNLTNNYNRKITEILKIDLVFVIITMVIICVLAITSKVVLDFIIVIIRRSERVL